MCIKMENNRIAKDLIKFITDATSPFHVVEKSANLLEEGGFEELDITKPWELDLGKSYFTRPYGTVLFGFTLGSCLENIDFRIAAAHTDYPCLKIKPNPDIIEGKYLKVNTGIYGGPILNTWLDRPLSIAGKVSLKSDDPFRPVSKLVDFKRPVLTIPNLAIHMNPEVNKGLALNKQIDLLPLCGIITEELNHKDYFVNYLAKELNVKAEDILDFDLTVYNGETGVLVGMDEEFISCPRLDNLTSVYACITGIIDAVRKDGINMAALFDNEEIGSLTKQGADSNLMTIVLEKIYDSLHLSHIQFYEAVMRSFLLSVDVAHCVHPNKPEKSDLTSKPMLNNGIVIKIDPNQKYSSDTETVAVIQQICGKGGIPYQKYLNRSDMPSGSTLGTMFSAKLPMRAADVGVPLLAMHSARELMGSKDQAEMNQLIKVFFN